MYIQMHNGNFNTKNQQRTYFLMSPKSMEEERLDEIGVALGTGSDNVGTTGCLEEGPLTEEDLVCPPFVLYLFGVLKG